MRDLKTRDSIDNSIRSLFQFIAVINDETGQYEIIDHNKELTNISAGKEGNGQTGAFKALRKSLKRNIHPADRDEFVSFTDRESHAAGDEAISVVSGELKNAAPTGSRTVRIGGDEFLIFAAVDKGSLDEYVEMADRKMYEMRALRDEHRRE